MPNWEYREADTDCELWEEIWGISVDALNKLGAEGWEVVSVDWQTRYGTSYMGGALLRRQVQEDPED